MHTLPRALLIAGGIALLILAAGFYIHEPWATRLWMWTDSPLSYYFVAAMQAAIAAAMLWIGTSGELAALAPGALNLLVMMLGCAVAFFFTSGLDANHPLFLYTIGCFVFALFNLWLLFWAHRIPPRDQRPLPGLLRISYGLFSLILAGVGIALLLNRPNVLPWTFQEDNQLTPVLFGWMFFGDAFYFLYAVLIPRWNLARAQLWSFLVYDLVLLGPFINRILNPPNPRPSEELMLSLYVYTTILVYSALLGVYYLLINPQTRRNFV
jgi:hypothetical protein